MRPLSPCGERDGVRGWRQVLGLDRNPSPHPSPAREREHDRVRGGCRCAFGLRLLGAESRHESAGGPETAAGETLLSVEDVSLSFGGVKAVSGVSFDIRKGEIRAIIGPNGAGKTSMLNVINGFYHPQEGRITFKGRARRRMRPYDAARGGIARTFQNVALFKGMTALDNIMTGRTLKMRRGLLLAARADRAGAARGGGAPPSGRGDHRLPEDPAHPQGAGRPAALRPAEARRARPRARHGARSPAARRADGRHERRGEGGHVPLHPRPQRLLRHDHRADRARHGRGDGSVRPRAWCSTTASRSPTARRPRCRPIRR